MSKLGLSGTDSDTVAHPGGSCASVPHGWLSGRAVTREGDSTRSWGSHQAQLRAGSQGGALPVAGAALGHHPGGQRHGTVFPEPVPPISTRDGADAVIPSQDHAAIQPPRWEGFPWTAVPHGDPTRLREAAKSLGQADSLGKLFCSSLTPTLSATQAVLCLLTRKKSVLQMP